MIVTFHHPYYMEATIRHSSIQMVLEHHEDANFIYICHYHLLIEGYV
jgi:hypothetical protein